MQSTAIICYTPRFGAQKTLRMLRKHVLDKERVHAEVCAHEGIVRKNGQSYGSALSDHGIDRLGMELA